MTWARWCASKHHYPDAHAASRGGSRRTPGASQQCVEALAPRGVRLPHEVLPQGGLRAPAVSSRRGTAAVRSMGRTLGQSPPALTGVDTAANWKCEALSWLSAALRRTCARVQPKAGAAAQSRHGGLNSKPKQFILRHLVVAWALVLPTIRSAGRWGRPNKEVAL